MKCLTNKAATTKNYFELNLIKLDFKLIFDNDFSPRIKSELEISQTNFLSKIFKTILIDCLVERE